VFGMQRAWWRRAVVLTAVLIGAVGLGWPEWQAEAFRFGLWLLAPVAALGLTWASRQAGPRGGGLVACVLGTILIADTAVMSIRPLSGQDARGFRDAFERALAGVESTGGTVIVAEDTRMDSALAAWMAGRADVWRAAQSGAVVSEALAGGRTVLAGPTARRHLLLAGVQFSDGFVIADPQPLVMSVAKEALPCATVRSDRWSMLPGVEYTGRLGIALPARAGGEMRVIVGDDLPQAVRVETSDGHMVPVAADALLSGPGTTAPPPDYWIESGTPEDSPPIVSLLHLPAHPVLATSWSVRLGRRAPRVLARLVGFGEAARGRVCAAPVGDRLWFSAPRPVEPVALDEDDVFGRGWYGLEGEGANRFRWTDTDPVLLLRSAERTDVTVELDAEPAGRISRGAPGADGTPTAADTAEGTLNAADGEQMTVTLRVNGIDMGTRPMTTGAGPYAWAVPAGVWLAGTNELWWHASHGVRPADAGAVDTRLLAMRVAGVTLRAGGAPADAAPVYGTETSSISKSRVALRGILGGLPAAP
ncbi:MAG: hypothetical protein OEW19_18665, partial [Acidobacteriota bacterium]|nr:hypothetical protein [Acidobacteriota bacterium]